MGRMIYIPNKPSFEVVAAKKEVNKSAIAIKTLEKVSNRLSKQIILFTPMIIPCNSQRLMCEIFGGIDWKVEFMPIAYVGGFALVIAFVFGTYKDIRAIQEKKGRKQQQVQKAVQQEEKKKQELVFVEVEDYSQLLD